MRPRTKDKGLPKRVYLRRGAYYFVTPGGKWIRLGGSEDEALRNLPIAKAAGKSGRPNADEMSAHIGSLVQGCEARARRDGLEFSIDGQHVAELLEANGWRCAVTGAPFSFDTYGATSKRPFAPSIDRIDNARGYLSGNCRIVSAVANIAMNAWGEGPLRVMAAHMAANGKLSAIKPTGSRPPAIKTEPSLTDQQVQAIKQSPLSNGYFAKRFGVPVRAVREVRATHNQAGLGV